MVVVMIVMGAIIYFISSISDDYEAKNADLQKKVEAIDTETKILRGRFTNIQKNIGDYKEVEKRLADNRLAINRQLILEKFNELKTQYILNNLHLTVTPAQDVKSPLFTRKNSSVNFSVVIVNFDITNDVSVYQLIDALRDVLPGITKLIKLDMAYQNQFDKDMLKEISQKGTAPLVKVEMQFMWYGINYVTPPATAPPGTPVSPVNVPK